MDFQINCRTITGMLHRQRQQENQDAYCSLQEQEVCSICVADGAGSRQFSGIGAAWLVRDICRVLVQHQAEIFQETEAEIGERISQAVQKSLEMTAARQSLPLRELSSTLLFVLTDGMQYVIGHLGDGVLIGERDFSWDILSFPENGSIECATYLTTMPSASQHLRIRKQSCDGLHRIWLMTDGMMHVVFQSDFSLPAGKSLEEIVQNVADQAMEDDATYGSVSWRREYYG